MPTFGRTFGTRKKLAYCVALAGAFMAPASLAYAQGCVNATREARAAILDVVKAPVAADLRTKVEFKVERARVCGSWSFVLATPQSPGGGRRNRPAAAKSIGQERPARATRAIWSARF